MDISVTVRDAQEEDIPDIIVLAKKFHAVSGYDSFDLDEESADRIIFQSISQGLCPVAEVDGKIVGFLLGLEFPAILNANIMMGTEIAWWVEPEHRNSVIGVKLLKFVENKAKQKNLKFWSMMCLEHLNPDGLEAIYLKMGYKKSERTYMRVF
jgi:GNAT superfamily N-acetyltransferase